MKFKRKKQRIKGSVVCGLGQRKHFKQRLKVFEKSLCQFGDGISLRQRLKLNIFYYSEEKGDW